jgi:hypothetical protein
MKRVLLLFLLLLAGSCGAKNKRDLSETKLPPEKVRDNELKQKKGPDYPVRPGMEELQRLALECYNLGLKHNPVFGKGGAIVIRWTADRNGDLLSMDFVEDSFRGWEVNTGGQTMAECITKGAQKSDVRWSRTGYAPLRFSPAGQPEPAGRPDAGAGVDT